MSRAAAGRRRCAARSLRSPALAAAGLAAAASVCGGQTLDWPAEVFEPRPADSGTLVNDAAVRRIVFRKLLRSRGAAWLRLRFGAVSLEPGSFVRVTSALDGQVQELDAARLALWKGTSAYFNGDAVLLELVAAPRSRGDRVAVEALARPAPVPVGEAGECGICGADDRDPAQETWACRLMPSGCTASVWNEKSCLVSAGHCVAEGLVAQFNVPPSSAGCAISHPPVADQFPIVAGASSAGGVGNDWSVLVPGPNALGELPYGRYGELRPMASSAPAPGDAAAVWGYGVDAECDRSQTQQTDEGSIVAVSPTVCEFTVDVRGGNSGSALVRDGAIVGVVTHCGVGGCPADPNMATRADLATFAAARRALCGEELAFSFPDGLPGLVRPEGGSTLRVSVAAATGSPLPGSALLHVAADGGPLECLPMIQTGAEEYVATFPAADCGSVLAFHVSARTTGGTSVAWPAAAPEDSFFAVAGRRLVPRFADDFENDTGWTVSGDAADGHWERALPVPHAVCDRGNPGSDADGSGRCALTDNGGGGACNSDVDGGSTALESPTIDASGGSVLSYWRWFSNTGAGQGINAFQDVLRVEISADGGATWSVLETVGPVGLVADGGWYRRSFSVGPAPALRVRFVAADADQPSVVEAAVDGFELASVACGCPEDLDDDGSVGMSDLLALLAGWGGPDGAGGTLGIEDLLALLAVWGGCGR
jgi:hypothetical protein